MYHIRRDEARRLMKIFSPGRVELVVLGDGKERKKGRKGK